MQPRDMTLAALFAVLTALLAQVSIPLPFSPVPITGQTLGVFLAGAILGKKNGTLAIIIYLMMGAIGLPVFSMGGAGMAAFVGPKGGYLIGFVLGVYAMGLVLERRGSESGIMSLVAGMLTCLVTVYILGTVHLANYLQLSFIEGLFLGAIPYIPLDLVKIALAVVISRKVTRVLRQSGFYPNDR